MSGTNSGNEPEETKRIPTYPLTCHAPTRWLAMLVVVLLTARYLTPAKYRTTLSTIPTKLSQSTA
jgi:hypothetical protein